MTRSHDRTEQTRRQGRLPPPSLFIYILFALALAVQALAFPVYSFPRLDTSETERHFTNGFQTRFASSECIVKMSVNQVGETSDDPGRLISRSIRHVLVTTHPKAAVYSFSGWMGPDHDDWYIEYADQCDRKFEITGDIADYINRRFFHLFEVTVSDENVTVIPGQQDLTEGLWLPEN